MSNQPYDGYGPYDPYQQQPQPQPPQQQYQQPQHPQQPQQPQQPQHPQDSQASWGYQDPYAAQPPYAEPQYDAYDAQQYTQQWQGQTWDTQVQPSPVAADLTETAYLPPQSAVDYGAPAQPLPQQQAAAAQYGAPAPEPEPSAPAPESFAPEPFAPEPAAPEPEPAAPAYGPATTTGNTRITDAQRARAEGRSPIIEPGMRPAALTALLGLLLAGAAAVGPYALLAPLLVLQGLTAAGWFRLNGMWPARQGIALAFLGGVVADVALLATGEGSEPAAILGTLGVWVLLVLVLQLRSHASPDERMYGLMAAVASAALAIVAAGHLAAASDAVTVGGVAVAAAVLARALPLPTPVSVVVALLAAAGGGIAVGGATTVFDSAFGAGGTKGALLGLVVGVCAVIGHRVAAYDYPSRFVHMTAGVALPLAAAAPAVYLMGRALG